MGEVEEEMKFLVEVTPCEYHESSIAASEDMTAVVYFVKSCQRGCVIDMVKQ